jgi:hypothetical protein
MKKFDEANTHVERMLMMRCRIKSKVLEVLQSPSNKILGSVIVLPGFKNIISKRIMSRISPHEQIKETLNIPRRRHLSVGSFAERLMIGEEEMNGCPCPDVLL